MRRVGWVTVIAILALGVLGLSGPAVAQQVRATLSGPQETPAVSTTGSGLFFATVDTAAQTISWLLFYQNLTGTTTFAHIHFGQRNVAGGIVAFLCGGTEPACPASGLISGVITPADITAVPAQGIAAGEFDAVAQATLAGLAYVNVHSSLFGPGEIRGQVTLVPTP